MKIFNIEIEVDGILGKHKKVVQQMGNHLQGAIRKLYQDEPKLVRVVRIL